MTSLGSAEEPFVFTKTPGKLPKAVVPRRYEIRIEPDLAKATMRGRETIEIEVREPVQALVLNALNLDIDKAVLHAADVIPLKPQLDQNLQTVTFALPAKLAAGTYRLELEFSGRITEQPEGLVLHQISGRRIGKGRTDDTV